MYNSLQEFLKEKESKKSFDKRRVNYLLTSIDRKHDDDTILNNINEITRLKIDLSQSNNDFLHRYLSSSNKINPIIVMHLIHLKKTITEAAHFAFHKAVVVNADGLYSDDEVRFLCNIISDKKIESKSPDMLLKRRISGFSELADLYN